MARTISSRFETSDVLTIRDTGDERLHVIPETWLDRMNPVPFRKAGADAGRGERSPENSSSGFGSGRLVVG
jgi:hypothetical protein